MQYVLVAYPLGCRNRNLYMFEIDRYPHFRFHMCIRSQAPNHFALIRFLAPLQDIPRISFLSIPYDYAPFFNLKSSIVLISYFECVFFLVSLIRMPIFLESLRFTLFLPQVSINSKNVLASI